MRAMELTDDEAKALTWLRDENGIQRNKLRQPSGKTIFVEHDLSGGHSALLRLLRSEGQIHHRLRAALAAALDPSGRSILVVQKRTSGKIGRPSKAEKSPARSVYEVLTIDEKIRREKQSIKTRRPQPAVGEEPRQVTTREAIKSLGLGKTKTHKLRSARKGSRISI